MTFFKGALCALSALVSVAGFAVVYPLSSYVQDGLVMHFDAIDNQATGSHVADATTWKCLKTGNEIPLSEGSAFRDGKCLYVTNQMSLKATFFGSNPGPNATLEVRSRPLGTWPSYSADWPAASVGNALAVAYDTRSGSGITLRCVSNLAHSVKRTYSYADNQHPYNPSSSVTEQRVTRLVTKVPYTYAVLQPNPVSDLYPSLSVNGQTPQGPIGKFYQADYTFADQIVINNAPIKNSATGLYENRILEDYAIRAYSRRLTNAELARNATIDQVRFGDVAAATTVTWTGAGGTTKWNNAANWQDTNGYPCLPGPGDKVVIANSSGATMTLENDIAGLSVGGLSITATSPVALTGNAITLTGAAAAWSSTGTITVGNPIVLGAGEQTFSFIGTVTLNGVVSGEGKLVKTLSKAGTVVKGESVVEVFGNLILTAENTYTGGTKILKGSIQGDHLYAFGPTNKTIYLDSNISTAPSTMHTTLRVNVTEFYYPVEVNSSYKGGQAWEQSTILGHNIDMLKADTHFRNTLSGGSIGIHAYTQCKSKSSGNAASGNGYIDGDVTSVGNVSLQAAGSRGFYVYGKMTALAPVAEPYNAQFIRLYNSGNRFTGYYDALSAILHAGAEDVLRGLSTTFSYFSSSGVINLHGFNQHIDRAGLFSNWKDARPPLAAQNHTIYADSSSGGSKAATLWLDATADSVSHERYEGALTLVYNPTNDYRMTCESNRVHAMSGALIISNGTFHVKGSTSFKNVSRVEVAPGATLEAYSTEENCFRAASELLVASGGVFKVASGSRPFSDGSAVTVRLDKDASLELPAGYTLPAVALYVDGVKKATDVYTKDTVPQIKGDGSLEITTPTVWKAGGANDNVDTAANWVGGENPPFDGSAAPTVTNGTRMTINRDVGFKGLTLNVPGTAGFTVTTNGTTAATLTLGTGGLTPLAAASGTQAYTFAAPISLLGSSTWAFPSVGTSVTLTQSPRGGAASEAYTIKKIGQAPLVLKGTGDGDYSGDWDIGGYVKLSGDDPFGRNVAGATGTVYVTAIGGSSTPDLLHFTGDTTVSKDVVFKTGTNNNRDFVVDSGANVTFLGNVHFAQALRKRCDGSGNALTFAGGVSGVAAVDEIYGDLIVTNKPALLGTSGPTSQTSTDSWYSFMAPSNEMNYIQFWYSKNLRFGANDAFYDGRMILCLCTDDTKYSNQKIDLGHYTNRISNISGGILKGRIYSTGGAAQLTISQQNGKWYGETDITDGYFRGTVEGDVSILMDGPYTFTLRNANTSVGSLAVTNGTLALKTDSALAAGKTASWAGSDIRIGGAGRLSVDNAAALTREAVVTISESGVMQLDNAEPLVVDRLVIDGTVLPAGIYGSSSSSAPAGNVTRYGAHFAGTGLLKTRHPKGVLMIIR